MPGLDELGSLLGMLEKPKQDDTKKRVGHDGQVLQLRVRTEKRRGKLVTIVWGFFSHPMELNRLLTLFKKSLGAGGQIVDQSIEMQGDHIERIKKILSDELYKVK